MLLMAATVAFLAGLALLSSASAARYRVGATVQHRAAWGPRGARWIAGLRWGVTVIWSAAWASQLGDWLARLALMGVGRRQMGWRLPGDGGIALITWTAASFLLLVAWLIAEGGVRRCRRSGWAVLVVGSLATSALVVFGVVRLPLFTGWLQELAVAFSTGQTLRQLVYVTAWSLPGLLAVPEWERLRGRVAGRRLGGAMLPAVAMLAATGLVALGGAFAWASELMRGRMDGHPIADAAGFAGLGGGMVAALLVTCVFWLAVPVIGLYAGARALVEIWPQRLRYEAAAAVTATATFVAVPLTGYLAAHDIQLESVLFVLFPIAGVVICDEVIRRRGELVLEELYRYSRQYGPTWGYSAAGMVALMSGWCLHPDVVIHALDQLPLAATATKWMSSDGLLVTAAPLSAVIAGATFVVLRPAETWVANAGAKRRASASAAARHSPPAPVDESSTTEKLEHPRFVSKPLTYPSDEPDAGDATSTDLDKPPSQ